jgi:hypothetical protein
LFSKKGQPEVAAGEQRLQIAIHIDMNTSAVMYMVQQTGKAVLHSRPAKSSKKLLQGSRECRLPYTLGHAHISCDVYGSTDRKGRLAQQASQVLKQVAAGKQRMQIAVQIGA